MHMITWSFVDAEFIREVVLGGWLDRWGKGDSAVKLSWLQRSDEKIKRNICRKHHSLKLTVSVLSCVGLMWFHLTLRNEGA